MLHEVAEEQTAQYGPFELEFFAVNHSIPDALAVAIKTQAGVVLHTGDFKMDQLPLDGRLTDLGGFARLGREEGIDLLLSDSTNAEQPGFVTSEREIGPVIDDVIRTAKGRVVVASFASHVHRVQMVLDAAHRPRPPRRVRRALDGAQHGGRGRARLPEGASGPAGRDARRRAAARRQGRAHVDRVAGRADGGAVPDGQQEPPPDPHHAAGHRADGLSSLIPGNENAVYRVINGLCREGARVVHKGNAKVHVSGHASGGELLYLLNATKPSNLMPVHGEWRHLRAHAELGVLTGVPRERIVLAEDGVVVDLVDGKASIVGAVECGYVYVDGSEVGDVTETTLKDRRVLGEEGFISLTLAVDSMTGQVAGAPQISARGFSDDPSQFNAVLPLIDAELDKLASDGVTDARQLAQGVRRVLGKWVSDTYRRRPMIIPVVLEV